MKLHPPHFLTEGERAEALRGTLVSKGRSGSLALGQARCEQRPLEAPSLLTQLLISSGFKAGAVCPHTHTEPTQPPGNDGGGPGEGGREHSHSPSRRITGLEGPGLSRADSRQISGPGPGPSGR